MRLKADLLLLLVAMIWGTGFVTQGIAAQYHLAYLFNGVSFVLAALVLLPFVRRGIKIPRAQWIWMLVIGFVLFVASALQQIGLFYTQVANAGFLTSLYVVFTPFLLFIGFKEKPHWLNGVAVLLAAVGAFFLSTAGHFSFQAGDLIEAAGSIFWALHVILVGKFASRFDSLSFASGHFLVSGLLNLFAGLFLERFNLLLLPVVIFAVLYRAILSVGVGYSLQIWCQKHAPPTDAALILGLESVFATLAGWIFLSQSLLPIQLAGCAGIFMAVLISQIGRRWMGRSGVGMD